MIGFICLFVIGLAIAIVLFKMKAKGANTTTTKIMPWALIIIFFMAFELFMHFLSNKPETKVIEHKSPTLAQKKPDAPKIEEPQKNNNDLENNEEAANNQNSPEAQPEQNTIEPKTVFEKPLAFKGSRNLTYNNLDYELLAPTDIDSTVEEIKGYDSLKQELLPFLKLLSNYHQNLKHNAIMPHGLILVGQNKEDMSQLALAIGKSWAENIVVVDALDIGVNNKGRLQIRELYHDTFRIAPLVVIIKNIESMLPATPPTIEYLESMQRFYKWFEDLNENNQPVLIIGITDNLYKMAPHAFKLGRFDLSIPVEDPNSKERFEILNDLFEKHKIKKRNIDELVKGTEGFSRRDLYNIVNQSLLDASSNNYAVSEDNLSSALAKVVKNKENFDKYEKVSELGNGFQLITPDEITARYSDLAGLQDVKDELIDALDGLKNPEKYSKIGATPPRGILLYGPPGTGKTMMARALAGESQVNFINVSGSEFVEEWVGTGAMRVKNLFNMARRNAPCIIFIDEFDALATKRMADTGGGGNNERGQTVNQLLVEMDNLDKSRNSNVFVIGATNNISTIDKAVLRPGRFDRKILFRLPNEIERKAIISHLLTSKKIKASFDAATLASETRGYSPAELNNLINQAALNAAKQGNQEITKENIAKVRDKVAEETMSIAKQDIDLDLEIFRPNQITSSFKSIAGLEDIKKDLSQMISFLKNPEKAEHAGLNLPKGWIFHGPPGTGKTSLARAVAGESGVTFISTSGSAFVQQWVGLGATRVRELFEVARQYAPCIIFIDEIDAVAAKRTGDASNSEYAQTTNQLLAELDNVNKDRNAGIVVIGATNRLDKLDDAIIRPGRLGKNVYVRLPNLVEREAIFKIYLAKIKAGSDVDVKKLASTTGGFSGADIENLVSEAALIAYSNNKPKVSMSDFENAKDIILLGRESSSNVLPDERKNTAYHEAGHALVGILSSNYPFRFYKITIGVRDETLGVTFFEENIERFEYSREAYIDILAMKLAGKIAEELLVGKNKVTSGPSNDLKQATQLAQDMVKKFGMGKADGDYVAYEYLDSVPDDTVNNQIEALINEAALRATKILTEHRDKLDALANALIEKETLSHDEVMKIINLPKANAP